MTFLTSISFQEQIEDIVQNKKLNYLDAIIYYCKEHEVDPEDIAKLVSANLKCKVRSDAMTDGLLKKEVQLPI